MSSTSLELCVSAKWNTIWLFTSAVVILIYTLFLQQSTTFGQWILLSNKRHKVVEGFILSASQSSWFACFALFCCYKLFTVFEQVSFWHLILFTEIVLEFLYSFTYELDWLCYLLSWTFACCQVRTLQSNPFVYNFYTFRWICRQR